MLGLRSVSVRPLTALAARASASASPSVSLQALLLRPSLAHPSRHAFQLGLRTLHTLPAKPALPLMPMVPASSLLSLAVRRTFATSSSPEAPQGKPAGGIKALLREYGTVALGTYLTLSFIVFCGCLSSIVFLGINETHIAHAFTSIKAAFGFAPKTDSSAEDDAAQDAANEAKAKSSLFDILPEWARSPFVVTMGTNVLLAMAMTKLFSPLKVAITAAIVPSVAQRLRAMGFAVGSKGGMSRGVRDQAAKHSK